jgi:hypothetical protein
VQDARQLILMLLERFGRELNVGVGETEKGLERRDMYQLQAGHRANGIRTCERSLTGFPSRRISLMEEMGFRPETVPCSSSVR